jgi:hypothetical protein
MQFIAGEKGFLIAFREWSDPLACRVDDWAHSGQISRIELAGFARVVPWGAAGGR